MSPLASMGAKIRVAYAYGLIGHITRDDLAQLTKIRNVFAHASIHVTFETPEISNACKSLRPIKEYENIIPAFLMMPLSSERSARIRYLELCLLICAGMMAIRCKTSIEKKILLIKERDYRLKRSSTSELDDEIALPSLREARKELKTYSSFRPLP